MNMDQDHPTVGPHLTEGQTNDLRQGVTLGRMRYVLGISLALTIIMFVVVYVIVLR
jgi:hypothetical protein